jgi:hypothetical protein
VSVGSDKHLTVKKMNLCMLGVRKFVVGVVRGKSALFNNSTRNYSNYVPIVVERSVILKTIAYRSVRERERGRMIFILGCCETG